MWVTIGQLGVVTDAATAGLVAGDTLTGSAVDDRIGDLVPPASTETVGKLRFATVGETRAGVVDNAAVTPAGVADAIGNGPHRRGTAAERTATSPVFAGLTWWQTDAGGGLWLHTGSGWVNLSEPGSVLEESEQGNTTITRGTTEGLIIGANVSNPWPVPMPVLVELSGVFSPSAGNNVAGYLFIQVNGVSYGQRRFTTGSTGDTSTLWPVSLSRPMVLGPGANTIHARASVDSLSSGNAVFSRRALSVQRLPRI